jgi:hypothetical protein
VVEGFESAQLTLNSGQVLPHPKQVHADAEMCRNLVVTPER